MELWSNGKNWGRIGEELEYWSVGVMGRIELMNY